MTREAEPEWLISEEELAALGLSRGALQHAMDAADEFAGIIRNRGAIRCTMCKQPGLASISPDNSFSFTCRHCGFAMAGSNPAASRRPPMTTTEAEERVAKAIRDKAREIYGRIGTAPTAAAYADEFARAAIDEMNRMAEEQFGHKVFVEAEKREARN